MVCVAVDGARGFVVVPLDHGDWEREVESQVTVGCATENIGNGFRVTIDSGEKNIQEELLVFLSPSVVSWICSCGKLEL